jgi:hypothetical protein
MERNYHSMFAHVINYLSIAPYLYRYENQNFIDNFFDSGELLISSFQEYKKYTDNQLGDKSEGSTMNIANIANDKSMITYTTTGFNDYCFCTSTVLEKELIKTFKRNSVFRIKDPINFVLEITRVLPRVMEVLYGHCIYLERKIIKKTLPNLQFEDFQNKDKDIELEKVMAVSNEIQGPDAYFIKERIFQRHSEFRIIWRTDRKVESPIKIICPEAIKYCEKIQLDEISDYDIPTIKQVN